MPELPHLAWPLRLDTTGALMEVEQDTLDDVRQCVRALLHTPRGSRPLAPDIGTEDLTFVSAAELEDVALDALAATLMEQEDRAIVAITAEPIGETGEQQLQAAVSLIDDPEEEAPTP